MTTNDERGPQFWDCILIDRALTWDEIRAYHLRGDLPPGVRVWTQCRHLINVAVGGSWSQRCTALDQLLEPGVKP